MIIVNKGCCICVAWHKFGSTCIVSSLLPRPGAKRYPALRPWMSTRGHGSSCTFGRAGGRNRFTISTRSTCESKAERVFSLSQPTVLEQTQRNAVCDHYHSDIPDFRREHGRDAGEFQPCASTRTRRRGGCVHHHSGRVQRTPGQDGAQKRIGGGLCN